MTVPAGYTARPASMDDLEAVLELVNEYANHVIGQDETSLERMRNDWETPRLDIADNFLLIEDADGTIVGEVEVWDDDETPVEPVVFGNVKVGYENRGLGTHLMTWAEERCRQVIERVPAEARVAMAAAVYGSHEPSHQLMLDRGLALIRHFWRMVIELEGPIPEPQWPDGLEVRPYRPELDAAAVYRAEDEAFQDHFGHIEESFEVGFERWTYGTLNRPGSDPALWHIAWDGEEIAGSLLGFRESRNDPAMGWVQSLSVRRPWRRRGLALALLQHSFRQFAELGQERVGLGVDAQNLTGATRLYEKAGMHVALQYDYYEKELRPGVNLMKRE